LLAIVFKESVCERNFLLTVWMCFFLYHNYLYCFQFQLSLRDQYCTLHEAPGK